MCPDFVMLPSISTSKSQQHVGRNKFVIRFYENSDNGWRVMAALSYFSLN